MSRHRARGKVAALLRRHRRRIAKDIRSVKIVYPGKSRRYVKKEQA